VEQWAELRREHFVRGVSIKQLVRQTGLARNTIRAALRSSTPPRYERAPAGSKLDPFKNAAIAAARTPAQPTPNTPIEPPETRSPGPNDATATALAAATGHTVTAAGLLHVRG
jgi:hypothetical protein